MYKSLLLISASVLSAAAQAEVYRWTDESGRVHYSDSVPSDRGNPAVIGVDARGGFVSSMPLVYECHSLRCQGERLDERLARREAAEERDFAARVAATPPPPRGLDFRKYIA